MYDFLWVVPPIAPIYFFIIHIALPTYMYTWMEFLEQAERKLKNCLYENICLSLRRIPFIWTIIFRLRSCGLVSSYCYTSTPKPWTYLYMDGTVVIFLADLPFEGWGWDQNYTLAERELILFGSVSTSYAPDLIFDIWFIICSARIRTFLSKYVLVNSNILDKREVIHYACIIFLVKCQAHKNGLALVHPCSMLLYVLTRTYFDKKQKS